MANNVRIVVRAFSAEGYHRDVLSMDTEQVRMSDVRVKEPDHSSMSGLIGFGGRIDPADFPEMTHFEIVVVAR